MRPVLTLLPLLLLLLLPFCHSLEDTVHTTLARQRRFLVTFVSAPDPFSVLDAKATEINNIKNSLFGITTTAAVTAAATAAATTAAATVAATAAATVTTVTVTVTSTLPAIGGAAGQPVVP